ncbi:unnamed protein product [Triticum turgidum subsp. durum]|uniref:F-box domain-containing protein n=1 Tax=Triticum turgidum subsp. durum TaxID=4567 RepID=A0A9R1RW53_TRITD|nr:unnamed protein product [Triticum turgidum subsp. durum]
MGPTKRHTTRLHPQIKATEDGVGVVNHRRSSKRRSIRIQASEGSDQVTDASEKGDGMSRRHRGISSEPPASVIEDENFLREILLHLPPDLHSLSCASAVCMRWQDIVVNHKFVRGFYALHRKLPLLGFFPRDERIMFAPVQVPTPNRILPGSFSLNDTTRTPRLARRWIPSTAASSSPTGSSLTVGSYKHPYACDYSSETDTWGNIISTEAPDDTPFGVCPRTLIGNALYWSAKHKGDSIPQFDLGMQNLAIIKGPPGMNMDDFDNFHIIHAKDGVVGLVALSHLEHQMWERKVDSQGGPTAAPAGGRRRGGPTAAPETRRTNGGTGGRQDNPRLFLGRRHVDFNLLSQRWRLFNASTTPSASPYKGTRSRVIELPN